MRNSKNSNHNQRRSDEQSDRFTAIVHIGQSIIRIRVVDENGRVVIREKWAVTATPVEVNLARKIAGMLKYLMLVADIEISDIRISLARDTSGRRLNRWLNDSQQKRVARELADMFHVRVTFEDAGSLPDGPRVNLSDFRPCSTVHAAPGDLLGTETEPAQTLEMAIDDHGVWVLAVSEAQESAAATTHRRRKL
jgi:hypothetical protein